jgi:hypothetical protein
MHFIGAGQENMNRTAATAKPGLVHPETTTLKSTRPTESGDPAQN